MANGKFSKPRPDREEEREIEQAFRQVTGQAAAPKPTPKNADLLDLDSFDIVFDDEGLAIENPPVIPEEPESFGDKAAAFLNRAVDFCNENRKTVLIALCGLALVLILGFMSIFFISTSDPYENTILNNVYIADIHVGGMTKDEAISAVKQATSHTYPVLDMLVNLSGNEIRLSPKDTDVSLDAKAAVNAAYDYGRTGTKAEQEKAYQASLSEKHIIGLLPYLELNEDYIRQTLNAYAQNTGSTLTQPTYGLDSGVPDVKAKDFNPAKAPAVNLVIRTGTPGISFDADSVYDQILDAYSLHNFLVTVDGLNTVGEPDPVDIEAIYEEFCIEPVNASINLQSYETIPGSYGFGFDLAKARKQLSQAGYGEEIRIPMEYIEPAVLNANMFFQDVLAEYETSYRDSGNLQTNLMLACEAINGTILNPGESFSFNNTVGQRTSAKGYKYADDQISTDKNRILGGGISQVSSALYYCALVSDLNVTNRTAHSLIPGYSDYGLDAAVGWATPDLKFTNTLGLPIRIDASAEGGKVKVSIMGTDERNYFVAMDYEISGTRAFQTEYKDFKADNDEGYKNGEVIQQGSVGYVIKTYRLKYDDKTGELISRDFVTTTQYVSVPKIIARVAAPEEPTEAPTEKPTEAPTEAPTETPTERPTERPTEAPTESPTESPSEEATEAATEESHQETTSATQTPEPEPSDESEEPAADTPPEETLPA